MKRNSHLRINNTKIKKAGCIVLFIFIFCFSKIHVNGQSHPLEFPFIKTLDSIRNSENVGKYFAEIYYQTADASISVLSQEDSIGLQFIDKLERNFVDYFTESNNAYLSNQPINEIWETYYSSPAFHPVKYQLLGINAHINGDLWKALTDGFTYEDLKKNKPLFLSCNETFLNQIYNDLYDTSFVNIPFVKVLHYMTFGWNKRYGQKMLHRWRKSQFELAEYYFLDKEKFQRRYKKINRKRRRFNRFVMWCI